MNLRFTARAFAPIACVTVIGLATAAGPSNAAPVPGQDGTVSVALADQTRVVAGSEEAQIVLRLEAVGLPDPPRRRGPVSPDDPVSPFEVVVLARAPVTSRTELQQAIDDAATGVSPSDVVDVVTIPYEDVRLRDGQLVVRVPLEIDASTDAELRLSEAGVHPLVVTVTEDGAPLAVVQTFVERLPEGTIPADASPLGVVDLAVAGLVDGPPSLLANGATRTDSDTVDEVRRVTGVLEAVPDVPLTIGVRPEVVEGLDRSREISDRRLLTEFATALGVRQLVAEPYVRIEPSSMVAGGLADTYVAQLRRGEDTLSALFPAARTVRSTAIVTDPLTTEGADLLRDLGVRTVVLVGAARDAVDGAEFADTSLSLDLSLESGDTLPALFVDPITSARLASTDVDPRLQAQRIMADLSVWLGEISERGGRFDGRTIVLTTPAGSVPDAAVLRALAPLVEADPRLAFAPLDAAAATTDPLTADGVPAAVPAADSPAFDVGDLAFSLGVTDGEIASTGSMLPDNDVRLTRWHDLTDVAASLDLDDAGRAAYIDAVVAETAGIRASVSGPPQTTFTLGGRTGEITLSLRNDADVPLTVVVRLSSAKLLFPEGPQQVELAPEATTIVRVPVEARSNNTFPVVVELLTPDGSVPVTPPVQLTARVTAFTGLGQLATGAAGIILATWWVRHWRTNRRRRLAAALATAPDQHPSRGRRRQAADTEG